MQSADLLKLETHIRKSNSSGGTSSTQVSYPQWKNLKQFKVEWWNGQHLSSSLLTLDTETTVVPFHMVPELVTCQVYDGGDIDPFEVYIHENDVVSGTKDED